MNRHGHATGMHQLSGPWLSHWTKKSDAIGFPQSSKVVGALKLVSL